MSVTIQSSSFGTLTVNVDFTDTTLSCTVLTPAPATLTLALGVPGPQGIPGPTGPSGAGIIPGGTTGQVLSKVDATDYNTQWSDPAVFTGGEVANPITMHDGLVDSEMSASFFGVELTSDTSQNASLSYTGLNVQISGSAMNVTATGITFPDSTVQTTAANPFNGGTIANSITWDGGINTQQTEIGLTGFSYNNYDFNSSVIIDDNQSGIRVSNYGGGAVGTSIKQDGITFPDSTVQTTAASLTGYATESFVTSQGYITQTTADGLYYPLSTNPSGYLTDATSDGQTYGRNNGSWVTVNGYTGGPLASDSTWTVGNQTTTAGAGAVSIFNTDGRNVVTDIDHLSITDAVSNSVSVSPAGITFTNTTTWAGIVFPDATTQTTAYTGGGPFLPLSGGTMTGAIVFDGTSGQYINKGNFDTSRGGNYGISLVCSIGYEFNWQAGWLRTTEQGSTTPRPLYLDSGAGTTLRSWNSGDNTGIEVSHTAITFPDASTQTVAFPGFAGYAPLASPALTGTPTAPTATLGDDSTQIATTAFVQDAVISGSAHAETLQATVRNNTGSTLASFTVVYISGAVGNKAAVAKAQANSEATSSGTFAVTESSIANNANGIVISAGVLSNVDTSAFTDGDKLYLSSTVAGGVTTTKPSAPNHLVYVGVVTRSHPTLGTVSVRIQNGYELEQLHNVAIASVADKDLLAYESSTTLWKNKSFSTLGLATLSGPTFTGVPAAPTASVSTNTTQLATTAFVVGQVGTATPLVNGTAAVGTSRLYARQDHVHGTDTSRAAVDSQAFTGTPSLPTGTTATTQTAGDNTTKLATTAFVTAGLSARDPSVTDVLNPNSSTKVLTLDKVGLALASPNFISLAHITYTQVSGSGAVTAGSGGTFCRETYLNSLATGRASFNYGIPNTPSTYISNYTDSSKIDWSKPVRLSGSHKFGTTSYEGDANTYTRITLGGSTTATTGDMTIAGIGIKKVGGTASKIFLTVHNGTTLTNVDSGIAPSITNGINWVIDSDGAGNVSLYINNSLAATTSAGPTSLSITAGNLYREQVEATATPTVKALLLGSGGWIYINR